MNEPTSGVVRRRLLLCLLVLGTLSLLCPAGARAADTPLYRRAPESYPRDELVQVSATQPQPQPPQPPRPRVPGDEDERAGQPRRETDQPRTVPPTTPRRTFRRSYFRLASVPNMFGDTFAQGGQLLITKPAAAFAAFTDLPLAGGARRNKIAENNKAMPTDRVYMTYNHFHNALDFGFGAAVPPNQPVGPITQTFPVNRYTVGLEKTFFNSLASVEVRMPLVNGFSAFADDALNRYFSVTGGEVGNLAINLKGVLYADACSVYAVGLGIDLPTGSDVHGATQAEVFTVRNEAVCLMPFVGFLRAPSDCWFYQGFAQVDLSTGPNPLQVDNTVGPIVISSYELETTPQSLLYLDLAAGRWLYRDRCANGLTGLAAICEVHYTTALENGQVADSNDLMIGPGPFRNVYGNFYNRVDILNATAGIHTEWYNHTTIRVGAVVPLRYNFDSDRMFDAEVQVQVNRRF